MKHSKGIKFATFILLVGAIGGNVFHVLGAGTAVLSVSPASGSYNINSTFTVTVYEDSGSQTVTDTSVDVLYDTSKLQYVSATTNNGSFSVCIPPSVSGNKVGFGCTMFGSDTVAGKQAVGTITFRAAVGSGSGGVTFGGSSVIMSNNQNIWNGSTAAANYSLTTPAVPAPTPTPTPTPAAPAAGSSTAGKAATGTTSKSAGSSGSSGGAAVATANSPAAVAAQLADPAAPVEATKATASDGHMVAIMVLDKEGKPQAGITVKLDGQTVKSDKTGVASFINVKTGSHEVTVGSDSAAIQKTIKISAEANPAVVSQFKVTLASKKNAGLLPVISGGVILLVAVAAFMILRTIRRLPPPNSLSTEITASPAITATPANTSVPAPIGTPAPAIPAPAPVPAPIAPTTPQLQPPALPPAPGNMIRPTYIEPESPVNLPDKPI